MSKVISFASDFGLNDGSVGVVKGVISRIDESIKVNDISHGIPPQDIKYGSLLSVSYTHLRAHETPEHLVCRLLLEKKKNYNFF